MCHLLFFPFYSILYYVRDNNDKRNCNLLDDKGLAINPIDLYAKFCDNS